MGFGYERIPVYEDSIDLCPTLDDEVKASLHDKNARVYENNQNLVLLPGYTEKVPHQFIVINGGKCLGQSTKGLLKGVGGETTPTGKAEPGGKGLSEART